MFIKRMVSYLSLFPLKKMNIYVTFYAPIIKTSYTNFVKYVNMWNVKTKAPDGKWKKIGFQKQLEENRNEPWRQNIRFMFRRSYGTSEASLQSV